jgi:DNA-binding MarR family transcriptional regulator
MDLMQSLQRCMQERAQLHGERFGLPDAELRCVLLFDGSPYLTPKFIATRLNVTKSRVTRILEGLARKGLVDRSPDPADSRSQLIRLSSSGAALREEIDAFVRETHAGVLDQLAPSERLALLTTLSTLKSCMEVVRDTMDTTE